MALSNPHCHGMYEMPYAAPERALLQRINDGRPSLLDATDYMQYHILKGLAVTTGSAFGYDPPGRELAWKLFLQQTEKADKQLVQLHKGGKAFTKHSHRATSGW